MEDNVLICKENKYLNFDDISNNLFDKTSFLSEIKSGERIYLRAFSSELLSNKKEIAALAILADGIEFLSFEKLCQAYHDAFMFAVLLLILFLLITVFFLFLSIYFYRKTKK